MFGLDGGRNMSLPRRIAVIGVTGSGKTTLAQNLAELLGLVHIELDAIHWGPNWDAVNWGRLYRHLHSGRYRQKVMKL